MSVKITFEAHSTTFDNEAKRASGWNDVALSPLGIEQSKGLGERCRSRGFAAVFCSDLQRSFKTAEIAFEGVDIPIIKDKRLRECDYGDFTLHPSHEVEIEKSKRIEIPFPNGESYTDTTRHMAEFLADLKRDYNGKHVLIVAHRAPQYALDHLLLGIPLKEIVSKTFIWQPGWEYELK